MDACARQSLVDRTGDRELEQRRDPHQQPEPGRVDLITSFMIGVS
jgi:hypothetical protein